MAPHSLFGAWLGVSTPDEAAACPALAAQLEATLEAAERRAVATLHAIGYAELLPSREDPRRQEARATAAEALLRDIGTLRHRLQHAPPNLWILQTVKLALRIEASIDEAIIGQWARRHAEHARQVREQQASEKTALRARVLRALARHPAVTQRRLAYLLDPHHPEQMRKRIARLDLTLWSRRKNKMGQSN